MLDKFTKDMLKPGMLVETRDGQMYKLGIHPESTCELLINKCGYYFYLTNFNSDLTNVDHEQYDVVRIYTPVHTKDNFSFAIEDHELIWERLELSIALTHDQIAEKLGIDPKKLLIVTDGMAYKDGAWRKA
jgi:hypothetical protein